MVCHNCGEKLAANALFCGQCGTAISQPDQNTEVYQEQDYNRSDTEQITAKQQDTNQQGGYEFTFEDAKQQSGYEFTYEGNEQNSGFGYHSENTTKVGFIEAVRRFFKHYKDFNGRASRTEFWWAFLFYTLVMMLVMCIPLVGALVWVGMIVPFLAIGVRRLHDMGLSGNFMFLIVLTGIGSIVLIVLWCMPSVENNQWGPSVRSE